MDNQAIKEEIKILKAKSGLISKIEKVEKEIEKLEKNLQKAIKKREELFTEYKNTESGKGENE